MYALSVYMHMQSDSVSTYSTYMHPYMQRPVQKESREKGKASIWTRVHCMGVYSDRHLLDMQLNTLNNTAQHPRLDTTDATLWIWC